MARIKINTATKITICRILILPFIVAVFLIPFKYHLLVTAILFVVASSTDFIDGHVARKSNTVTVLGKFLDPIADKMLVVVALFMIIGGDFLYKPPALSIIAASLIMSRELIINGFRLIASHRGIVIAADVWGKIKTVVLDISLPLILCNLNIYVTYVGWVLLIAATVLSLISGANYILKNKKVFLEEEQND